MRDIKIAIISASFPPLTYGGVGTAHYNLYKLLKKHNFIIKLFSYKDLQNKTQEENDIVRFKLPDLLSFFFDIITKYCWKLIDRRAPCIQLKEAISSIPGGFVVGMRIRKFSPDIIILPDRGASALWIGNHTKSHIIGIMHHNPDRFRSPLLLGFLPSEKDISLELNLEKLALKNIAEVVCPSYYMAKCIKQTFSVEKMHIIPNVIDIDELQKLFYLKQNTQKNPNLIYIPSARFPNKGERYLFEIIHRISKKMPQVRFFVSGGMTPLQKEEIDIAGLTERIYIAERLPYAENIKMVASCSMCISLSLTESYGMAICEAALLALPCIAFDSGGVRDIITDGETGFLVPLLDLDLLIEKVIFLLSHQEIAHSFGQKAQEKAISTMKMAEQSWVNLITNLAQSHA